MPVALTPVQVVALSEEVDSVVRLSRLGIDAIGKLDGGNTFVHFPLQLLAQSFERLLKLTMSLALLGREGSLPSSKLFKGYGHDILRLTDDLLEMVQQQPDYVKRPAVQAGLDFISSDPELRRLLKLLSTFGSRSRYYRLEEFLDPDRVEADEDPDLQWEKVKTDFLNRQPEGLSLLTDSNGDEFYRRVSEYVTGLLDRFARAITRMWTLGAVHTEARQYSGILGEFLFLRDEDLGA